MTACRTHYLFTDSCVQVAGVKSATLTVKVAHKLRRSLVGQNWAARGPASSIDQEPVNSTVEYNSMIKAD